jgi:hypothetical protein
MTDFNRVLDKAMAEIAVAKTMGPRLARAALVQARFHVNLAIDDAARQTVTTMDNPPDQREQV